mgnify:CR=1 FL=1
MCIHEYRFPFICIKFLELYGYVCTSKVHSVLFFYVGECVAAMAIASSGEFNRRLELYHQMRVVLHAAGVPREAWPQRLPRTDGIYHRRNRATGAVIQVCMLVRRYLVPRTCPPRGHSVTVPWGDDPAAAWEKAKALVGW